ncbi:MAG: protein translocase subunit SecF [bacterium]
MKLRLIQNRKYFYIVSFAMFVIGAGSLAIWGLKPGIDFTGGSLLQVKFTNIQRPTSDTAVATLKDLNIGDISAQPAGDSEMLFRFKTVDEDTHQKILSALSKKFSYETTVDVTANGTTTKAKAQASAVQEQSFETVGPVIGKELGVSARNAIALASIAIILYIAYTFRKVSRPVVSWKYGVSAVVALLHDLIITAGFFAVLGHFFNVEIDSMFISAMLTILGFSVHDTIVVFDRTRENLSKHYSGSFEEVVNDSVNQTIARSINTSLTTLLVLTALYLFGGRSIANFALALIFGITIGTYSSIFVASPLIVSWHNLDKKLKAGK